MQYAIPEISIDPELIVCQKCICAVAFAIIDCERQISGKNCLILEIRWYRATIYHSFSRAISSLRRDQRFVSYLSVDRLSENSHVTAPHIRPFNLIGDYSIPLFIKS
jgi:hypothetical protein